MLILDVKDTEVYDGKTEEFQIIPGARLQLEHSLIAMKKWESIWHKPLLKSLEEGTLSLLEYQDYIRCMTINQQQDLRIYRCLTQEQINTVSKYINEPMTATTFSNTDDDKSKKKEIITAELIYWWMTSYRIPWECQKWHLNQLMTLLHIAAIKNQPPKKMSKRDIMNKNRSLNAARRKKLGSAG